MKIEIEIRTAATLGEVNKMFDWLCDLIEVRHSDIVKSVKVKP